MSYHGDDNYRSRQSSSYNSVFERLSVTETHSSAGRRYHSPGETRPPAFSGYRVDPPSIQNMPSIQSAASSSSRLVSPKIFDRLANTETYASAKMKGKIVNQKRSSSTPRTGRTSNSFWERMAYTETFATAQRKGLIDTKERPSSRSRSVRSARSEGRSMSRGSSFWDRMSKTETFASTQMKSKYRTESSSPTKSPSKYGGSRSVSSRRSISSRRSTGGNLYDRLSRTETLATMHKKKEIADMARAREERAKTPKSGRRPTYMGRSYTPTPSPRSASPRFRKPVPRSHSPASDFHAKYDGKKFSSSQSLGSRKSVGSARSAGTRSVATTRSATTARSLGTTTVRSVSSAKTAKSTNTMRSGRSSYAGNKTRPSVAPPAKPRRGLPPPSPKARSSMRAGSANPKPIYGRKSPVASSQNLQKPKPSTRRTPPLSSARKPSVPKAKPAPAPAPRPVLKFDDDDELSFGSEESDEASLGPSSVKAPPQDAQSVTSKRSTASGAASLASGAATATSALTINTFMEKDESVSHHSVKSEHSATPVGQEEVKPAVSDDNVEDYLDELEEQDHVQEEEHHEHAEVESEMKTEAVSPREPLVALVHESDDELSFGSDEGDDDDWLGTGTNNDAENENNEKSDTHEEPETFDELGDVLDSDSDESRDEENFNEESENEASSGNEEMSEEHEVPTSEEIASNDFEEDTDLQEDVGVDEESAVSDNKSQSLQDEEIEDEERSHHSVESDKDKGNGVLVSDDEEESIEENGENDHVMIETEENPVEDDVMDKSMEQPVEDEDLEMPESEEVDDQHDDESMGQNDDQIVDDNDDDLDYGSSYESDPIDNEPQIIEEEYDEEEDLEQMDSLDLILDATKSGEERQDVDEIVDDEDEFDAAIADHSESGYKILKSEKYHPEYGLQEIHPDELYLKETLQCFEDGDISNEEMAILLIEALFEKDFENGEHWEIDAGTARELEEDEGGGGDLEDRAFVVKRQARLDWNDLYSVAAAKGTIIIDPDNHEIRVENYSYFVAG